MSERHLSNGEFFVRLTALFDGQRQKDHGSIYLTQKRMTYGHESKFAEPTTEQPFPDLNPTQSLPVIIRATNGKSKQKRANKIKISTVVEGDGLDVFFTKYAELCKLGMSNLKKRDRSKQKEKLKAKKKKQSAVGTGAGTGIKA